MNASPEKPLILITGAAGNLGSALSAGLKDHYRVVGLDRTAEGGDFPLVKADFTSDASVADALKDITNQFGNHIASVIHLAAYFDFTGEDHPLYRSLNVEGTRRFLRQLQAFEVEQFIYSGTMLVHAPGNPGERIDEDQPLQPKWAYPQSKAAAEEVIIDEHGHIPYVLLHLAGIYDEKTAVPTLSHQIARIYERDFQSYLYSGDPDAGQSMLHKADMVDAFRRTVDRRADLPADLTLLIGEPDAMGYGDIQDELGRLIHGEDEWATIELPKPVAVAGSQAMVALEAIIPDAIDLDDKPFIRPFMVTMADDHYALDISRAQTLLGWKPAHHLRACLPDLVAALKADPMGWYEANGVMPPDWVRSAAKSGAGPEDVRVQHERKQTRDYAHNRWAHFANISLGTWLLTMAPAAGVGGPLMWSEILSGATLILFAVLSLSPRIWPARWICAAIGFWVLAAPMIFWTPSAAAYLNDTLLGALIIILAVGLPPEPGISPASVTGPTIPHGWSYNPSSWTQRLPIIALALLGLYVSRYMAAYQLGHIDGVWEPFFGGGSDPKNGTEEIITSSVSEAWPVPDAAVGALTYVLEIVTGIIGSRARWRTMPWLVIVFGLMIVPLGVVSIAFIIIQPIVIGTWCTLCLIGAAFMLIQIPYSLDELVATGQFLNRRRQAGHSLWRVLFTGDTDEGRTNSEPDEFARPPFAILRDMVGGGVSLPWNLAMTAVIGVWLMLTRVTLNAEGGMADADHVVGALVLTVVALAAAEVARPVRFLTMPLGAVLLVTPFVYPTDAVGMTASFICGVALIGLAIPRGRIRQNYDNWNRLLV